MDGLALLWCSVPFHFQPDQPGKVCRWASAPSECSPVWRLSGKYCDSWSCARSCLQGERTPVWSVQKLQTSVPQMVGKQQGSILLVTATCLFDLPSSIVSMTSSGLQTNLSVQPFKAEAEFEVRLFIFTNRFYQILDTGREVSSHLDVGYSVFVFMDWQVGLWHWRREEEGVIKIDMAYCVYTTLI